jgi:bifunctional UDP-N-acetylglucosamine pyrophosphorylase/glucosamine-1-phosphate N-acetyltransferase
MKSSGTSVGVIEVDDTTNFGVTEISGDKVVRILEKVGESRYSTVNSGVYHFTSEIFTFISRTPKSLRGEYEITDSLQLMIDGGYPVHYRLLDHWLPLSYPWDLLAANEYLLKDIEPDHYGEVEPGVTLRGSVRIDKNTLVRSGSYIIGPVTIGQNCIIGPNCFIRPYTSIGDDCHIGSAVEVKNSIVMRATNIPHHNYVGDSIIGEMCNLGAGTKIANLRLDKTNVMIGKTNTGRRKLGAIIGDNVETGINACINVGCIIGSNVRIGPRALAHGLIPAGAMIMK